MTVTRKKLPGEPIVIVTLHADYDFATEGDFSNSAETFNILDSAHEPVYFIIDLSEASFSFDALVAGSSAAARGDSSLFHHPNINHIVFVTQSEMSRMTAQGMDSDAFGHLKIAVFGTLEEALDMARSG